jgi:DNA replication protein DnaC
MGLTEMAEQTTNPTMTMTDDEQPQTLAAEERSTFLCPSCGEVELTKVIPAGISLRMARMLRKLTFQCEECGAAEDAAAVARERAAVRRKNEQACNLPPELRGLTWDSYSTERRGAAAALAAAQAWAKGEHEKRGLMLVGGIGVGKTRLAATAAWAALGDHVDPRRQQLAERAAAERGDMDPVRVVPGLQVTYVNVAELIVKMQAGFGDRERADALRVLTGKGAIVLDDLDKIHPTMTVLSHLYAAIDGRVQAGAPMIVTTNLTPNQLLEKLAKPGRNDDADEREVAAKAIVSRLAGHCTIHGIQGEDGRRA